MILPPLPEATRKAFSDLTRDKSQWFLLVGNGVNRFPGSGMPSWADLLTDLLPPTMKCEALSSNEAHGITYTEIFDLAVLQSGRNGDDVKLAKIGRQMKERVVKRLSDSRVGTGHKQLVTFCQNHQMPLLTTNFDHTLEKVAGASSFANGRMNRRYYPWDVFHSKQKPVDPLTAFSIWHVHGSTDYPDSLRLGLNDYTGAIQRIRSEFLPFANWVFHGKHGTPPEAAKRLHGTWVEILLTRSPIIVGLELAPYDMLLRWLLLRRAAAHHKLPANTTGGIYLSCKRDKSKQGMEEFFRLLNIRVIFVDEYPHCYDLFVE